MSNSAGESPNGSRRSAPLPPNWGKIASVVLMRDRYRCRWGELHSDGAEPGQCSTRATDADHMGDPNDHDPNMLRALCRYHHDKRTAAQANAARGVAGSDARNPRRRPTRPHPGAM